MSRFILHYVGWGLVSGGVIILAMSVLANWTFEKPPGEPVTAESSTVRQTIPILSKDQVSDLLTNYLFYTAKNKEFFLLLFEAKKEQQEIEYLGDGLWIISLTFVVNDRTGKVTGP